MNTTTITWTGTLTARSSIAHAGESKGVMTLLRRELVAHPDGRLLQIPIISGNSFRGRLRRLGEELTRDVLNYEGQLSLGAAHALRGGGALTKASSEPLSGSRLRTLRQLLPHLGVFGAAGGGRIIDGALQVGKVVPHLTETAHLTDIASTRSVFSATQLETYTRHDDATDHDTITPIQLTDTGAPAVDDVDPATQQMLYRIETFPAGTRFSTWLRLTRATDLEAAYFTDVLKAFTTTGRLGGRLARGHGQITTALTPDTTPPHPCWRTHLRDNRDAILTAVEDLA